MNEDGYVSKWNVAAGALWAIVVVLVLAAWVVALWVDNWPIAGMLATTGLATSAAASVLHVRGYFVRLSRLVRIANGIGVHEDLGNYRPRSVR